MIISAADLKQYIETEESDPVLEVKLQALESLIRKYTNNNFQLRTVRSQSAVLDNKILQVPLFFAPGFAILSSPFLTHCTKYKVIEAFN